MELNTYMLNIISAAEYFIYPLIVPNKYSLIKPNKEYISPNRAEYNNQAE